MAENRRSSLHDESVAAASTVPLTMAIADQESITVTWAMTNAGAAGDFTNLDVRLAVEGQTLPTPLTPEVVHPKAISGPVVAQVNRYDVRGIQGELIISFTTTVATRTVKVFANSYRA